LSYGGSGFYRKSLEVLKKTVDSKLDIVVDNAITRSLPGSKCELSSSSEILRARVVSSQKAVYGNEAKEPINKPKLAADHVDNGCKIE